MKFNLIPFVGTDIIKFGMTSEEIQSIMKFKPTILKKLVTDLYYAEDYQNICHVYYELSENNIFVCAEFEFFRPSKVFIDNIQVIGETREKVSELFRNKFEDYIDEGNTALGSEKYEIKFYAPQLPRKKCIVESVSISRKGFRKQLKEYLEKVYGEEHSPNNSNKREYICLNCKDVVCSEQRLVKCTKCNVFMIPK